MSVFFNTGRNFFDSTANKDTPYEYIRESLSKELILGNSLTMIEITTEAMIYGVGGTNLIFESIARHDYDLVAYISEGILSTVVGAAVNLIKKALGFVRGLHDKVNNFIDQFEGNSTRWLSKYRTRVEERAGKIKDHVYTGYKWNRKYFESSAYPTFHANYAESAKEMKTVADEYNRLMRSSKGSGEMSYNQMDNSVRSLDKKLSSITKTKSFTQDTFSAEMKKTLGCEQSEIHNHYMELARGGKEKVDVERFQVMSVKDMLDHISKSSDLIQEINKKLEESAKGLGDAFDIIKDLSIEDYATTKSFNSKDRHTEMEKDKDSKMDDDEAKYVAKKINSKESGRMNNMTEYSKTLGDSLNNLINMWRKYTDANNMLAYVHLAVVRDSTKEFITVLTQFANSKSK